MKRRTRKNSFLLVLLIAVGCVGLGGGKISGVLGVGEVGALEYQDNVDVQFGFNPTMSVTVSGDLTIGGLTPGGSAIDSNIVTVEVGSNNVSGYTLYTSVGDDNNAYTDLRLSSDNTTNVFSVLATAVSSLNAIGTNEWGYSYCNSVNDCTNNTYWVSGNAGSAAAGYGAMPLYNSGSHAGDVMLVNSSDNGNAEIKFKIGAKAAANQVAGNYTNVINFVGVSKVSGE